MSAAASPQPRDIAAARRAADLRDALGDLVGGLLERPGVTDVYLNPPCGRGQPGELWVVEDGEPARVAGTLAAPQAVAIISSAAGLLGDLANEKKPWVEGELFGDGPRFDALLPPAVTAPTFNIRKPAPRVFTLAEYVAAGIMTDRQRARLEAAVTGGARGDGQPENIVVVGATGAGKTTLLNALGEAVHRLRPADRIVLSEGTREVRLLSRDAVSIRTGPWLPEQGALRRILRMVPRRVWVGEVRGPEAHDMLMAWNTGHAGGAASLHSDTATPEDALERLEDMTALANNSVPQRRAIGRAVDLIVCLRRDDAPPRRRRITGIYGVHGFDAAAQRYRTTQEG